MSENKKIQGQTKTLDSLWEKLLEIQEELQNNSSEAKFEELRETAKSILSIKILAECGVSEQSRAYLMDTILKVRQAKTRKELGLTIHYFKSELLLLSRIEMLERSIENGANT